MSVNLTQILNLVGKLDDSPGDDTPRERFRGYLRENVKEVGRIRDYVEECLRNSGDQYNRALQDLVNHLATFLGFDVTFGRYQGVLGQPGYDGLWKSSADFFVVAEVKTTEVYAIRTATLVGYVDDLISGKKIPNWDHALGLYVIGRPDPELRQLESSVIAEKRIHQLRIISVEHLLTLAESKSEYDISHEDILAVLRPSGPKIDPIVELMKRLIAQKPTEVEAEVPVTEPAPEEVQAHYWLTPVRSDEKQSAEEVIRTLVGEEKIYAIGERTPGRKHIRPGDWVCFYASENGVVSHAEVASAPEHKHHPKVKHPEKYPWIFPVKNVHLYINKPVIIDMELRSKLEAFRGKDATQAWGWFVVATRRIAKNDFELLTRHNK